MRQRSVSTLVLLAVLLVLALQSFAIFPEPVSVGGIYDAEYDDVLALISSEAALTELVCRPAPALTQSIPGCPPPNDDVASRLAFALDPVRAPPLL
jgi:hypothetical protein